MDSGAVLIGWTKSLQPHQAFVETSDSAANPNPHTGEPKIKSLLTGIKDKEDDDFIVGAPRCKRD